MAALFNVLKAVSQLHPMRTRFIRVQNIQNIKKYLSCTSFRLGNDRDTKRDHGSGSKENQSDKKVNVSASGSGHQVNCRGETPTINNKLHDLTSNVSIAGAMKAEKVIDFVNGKGDDNYPNHIRVFTDASRDYQNPPNRCGVGIYSKQLEIEKKYRVNNNLNIHFCEYLGLMVAVKTINEIEAKGTSHGKSYIVMTDSMDALKFIKMQKEGSDTAEGRKLVFEEMQSHLKELDSKGVGIVFSWIPSHFCIPGAKKMRDDCCHANSPSSSSYWRYARRKTKKVNHEAIVTRIEVPTDNDFRQSRQTTNDNTNRRTDTPSNFEITAEEKFKEISDSMGLDTMAKTCQYVSLFKKDYGDYATVLTDAYYTDTHEKTGFGVWSETLHFNISKVYSGNNRAYSKTVAFILAMKLALKEVREKITKGDEGQELLRRLTPKGKDRLKVLVLTNNQDAIQELLYPTQRADVVEKIKTILQELQEHKVDVVFSWMPWRWELEGNRKADELAKLSLYDDVDIFLRKFKKEK